MREPSFWWQEPGLAAWALSPLARVYGAVAGRRMGKTGAPAGIPVICVGNFTLGGTGKTPAALAFAEILTAAGEHPYFLTRGYGGALTGPIEVEPTRHRAGETGDEPLLLARRAPTVVARDRPAGALFARQAGASVIVMDDGLQNPSLRKDLSIAVIDARRGIGNGFVCPAGPLRASLGAQMPRTDAVLIVGEGRHYPPRLAALLAAYKPQVLRARLTLDETAVKALGNRKVLAFAGIGDPEKFFMSLAASGIEAAIERSFDDHHQYTEADANDLLAQCERSGLIPVTTEKDAVRLTGPNPALAKLAAKVRTLPARLVFEDEKAVRKLLLDSLKTARSAR